ncbi:MAG: hypothetical protein V4606_00085 [Patescibacteria group bacterium]
MSFSSPIVPAIIPQSFADLQNQISKLRGLPEVHVDVVDGVFVSACSWPYSHHESVITSFQLLEPFSLEVDLMVEKPLPAALEWLKAGADQLVFHIETIAPAVLENFVQQHDVTIGVALSSNTSLETLYPYLPFIDYVQLMGIATIGAQGQPFDISVLERISVLRENHPHIPISIDGSVNAETLPQLKNFSLERYIVGSAIMGADNPREAYRTLTALVQS